MTWRRTNGFACRSQESGYALVAAVGAILFFSAAALGVYAFARRTIVSGTSEVDAVRARAAADAGIALALDGLIRTDARDTFRIDGTPRRVSFDGATIDIAVTDERGKVPLNLLDDRQLTQLFETIGLSGDPLLAARDAFLDWIDDDDEPRAYGAERAYYKAKGFGPRNSGFVTVSELGRVRGFTPDMVKKIAAIATTDFGTGSFDARTATPAAIHIMYPGGDAAVEEIVRARESRGQVTALDFVQARDRVARPMTISATASYPSGSVAQRQCVIELTGARYRPYIIRHCV